MQVTVCTISFGRFSCFNNKIGTIIGRFTYIESWRTIQIANAIFGFNGWSCTVVDLTPDYVRLSFCILHNAYYYC